MANPFAKAQKAAKPLAQNTTRPEVGVFDQAKFDDLCTRVEFLIANNPEFAGLKADVAKVEKAGASSKGSVLLGSWTRGATAEHRAGNIMAYRSGSLVCTNVPLAPILA